METKILVLTELRLLRAYFINTNFAPYNSTGTDSPTERISAEAQRWLTEAHTRALCSKAEAGSFSADQQSCRTTVTLLRLSMLMPRVPALIHPIP